MFKKFFENTLRNDLSPILRMRGQYKTSHRNLENLISHPREILLILNVHPACLVRENAAEIWGRNGLGQNGKTQITADTLRRSIENVFRRRNVLLLSIVQIQSDRG